MSKELNAEQKQARRTGEMASFVQEYARKARKGLDANDRRHDRSIQARIRRMPPEELDLLLREDDI